MRSFRDIRNALKGARGSRQAGERASSASPAPPIITPHPETLAESTSDDEEPSIEKQMQVAAADQEDPPVYSVESDVATDKTVNPRLVQADKRLMEASRELLHALRLYNKGIGASQQDATRVAFLPADGTEDDVTAAAELVRDPEKLSAFVSRVLDEQKDKKATLSSRFGGAISKVYPLLSLTLGTTSAVAEGAAFVPVKGTVNALSLLLSIADQEHTKSVDFLKQLDRISFQALRVAAIKKPGHGLDDIVLEKATDLMTAILVFFKGSLLYLKHDFFYHVWKGILLGPQVYAEAKADLGNAINEFDQALLMQITLPLISTQQVVQSTREDTNGPVPAAIQLVKWLQSSYWEVEQEFARHCRNRVPGTLKWVFDTPEFKAWRCGEDDQRQASNTALWLSGLPGVGKSTIAAYVVQALRAQHPDACILYFFCKSGDAALNSLPQLVRTLAAQLAPVSPSAREHFQNLQSKDFDVAKSDDPLFLLQKLLRDPICEADDAKKRETFVVLDGLDECSTKLQSADLESLLKAISSIPSLKLLVSSRVTAQISNGLSHTTKKDLSLNESRNDIELYVNHRVDASKNLDRGFRALGIEAAEFLSAKSNGNFLWVRLVLDSLQDRSSVSEFQTAMDTLPKDLETMYEQLLRGLESRGHLELVLAIFRCVLYSKRPLTISETEAMASLMMGDRVFVESFVEAECGSLLRQTATQPPTLYIVHETFRSFITTKSCSKENCAEPMASHVQLLIACLGCLTEVDKPNEQAQPARNYAGQHWLYHLAWIYQEISAVPDVDLQTILLRLHVFWTSSTAVQAWMRDYAFSAPENLWGLGARLVSFHHIVDDLIQSEAGRFLNSTTAAGIHAPAWDKTLSWLSGILSGTPKLSEKVKTDFYRAWLDTNWVELATAKGVFRAAADLPLHLQHRPKLPSSRGEWVRDFPFAGRPNRSALDAILATVDFDDMAPLQVGNVAIALLEVDAESTECAERFIDALQDRPNLWHLHEGLAEYYNNMKQSDEAISALEKALAADTKPFPSSAYPHARLVSRKLREAGDTEGAARALREGMQRGSGATGEYADKFWEAMAAEWESLGDGNKMIEVYQEAVDRVGGRKWWEKLAETYGRGGAPQLQWNTLRKAIAKDPENCDYYGQEICKLARHLTALCVWQPVTVMLTQGATEDPDNAHVYHRQLGKTYMCQRRWRDALQQFDKVAELSDNKWVYEDIGNAYLGLGETSQARTAYRAAVSEALSSTKALTLGCVYMLEGAYAKAARLFTRAIDELDQEDASGPGGFHLGQTDDSAEQRRFRLHLQLALCLEATGKTEEATENFASAVDALKPVTLREDADKERNLVYRHHARSLFHIGLVEEKLGRREDAKVTLERAVFLFEKTTMEGDDEIQTSEAEEAAATLERVSGDEVGGPAPDLKETIGSMRLARRLALPYTTDWYCAQKWQPPRRRGWKEWNEVRFVNKFTVHQGDRIVIVPWGYGHY